MKLNLILVAIFWAFGCQIVVHYTIFTVEMVLLAFSPVLVAISSLLQVGTIQGKIPKHWPLRLYGILWFGLFLIFRNRDFSELPVSVASILSVLGWCAIGAAILYICNLIKDLMT